MIDDKKIIITDEQGKKHDGEILFTFEANGDDFVFYELDNSVFTAKVNEENNLSPVLDDEWPLIEKVYNEFIKNMEDIDKENE